MLIRGRHRQRADAPASAYDPNVSKAFRLIDFDGNGSVGREEVKMALDGRCAVHQAAAAGQLRQTDPMGAFASK